MSNEIDFRNLNQASELENITENTKVVVLEDGITKQTDATNFIKADELPAVTSEDNGDILTVVNGAWAKAVPSGGNNDFVVTYTLGDTIIADKTFAEIKAAYEAGKNIKVIAPFVDVILTLTRVTDTFIVVSNICFVENKIQYIDIQQTSRQGEADLIEPTMKTVTPDA